MVFRSNRSGFSDLYRRQLDTTLPTSLLDASTSRKDADDWSPDGRTILVTSETAGTGADLWTLPVDAPARAAALVAGPGWQTCGRFSPDGHLVAYQSTENGVFEVFVQLLGPSRRRWRVGPGEQPMWRRDGRELFFVDGSAMMAVKLAGGGEATALGPPTRLFDVQLGEVARNAYAVTPDGTRFLTVEPVAQDAPPTLMVLLDPPF
jgi:Tol biopolymer transport system component